MSFVTIESLDFEGRGIAHVEGKTIFIAGALPFEEVSYSSYRKKPNFENADVQEIRRESYLRTTPRCEHFGVCGGCAMQHMEAGAQVAAKQRVLEDNLWHLGKVRAEAMLPPIYGPAWGYRHRARLSVRRVEKKGGMLVGFHEKRSTFIADMRSCKVLPPHVSDLLLPLRELIGGMSISTRLPQVEVAVGSRVTALVLRIMDPLTPADEDRLRAFADRHGIQFWLQTKGPETAAPFYPLDAPELSYELPEFGVTMPYKPTEFTQVNSAINQVLVQRAIKMLDPQPGETIADMFCGLGNFTLPIASRGATVLGVEGSQALVDRARLNAQRNGLDGRTRYAVSNLFEVTTKQILEWGSFDKMLIDPPRDGALELVKNLPEPGPSRIVYVSCNPATLARDAGILVNVKGYRLRAAGVVNMFPHTGHVESIAWFER